MGASEKRFKLKGVHCMGQPWMIETGQQSLVTEKEHGELMIAAILLTNGKDVRIGRPGEAGATQA
jgi:hypothetical protein